jgi:hypothetical protein
VHLELHWSLGAGRHSHRTYLAVTDHTCLSANTLSPASAYRLLACRKHRCSSRVPSPAELRRAERFTNRTLERMAREGTLRRGGPYTIDTWFHVIRNGNGQGEQHRLGVRDSQTFSFWGQNAVRVGSLSKLQPLAPFHLERSR